MPCILHADYSKEIALIASAYYYLSLNSNLL